MDVVSFSLSLSLIGGFGRRCTTQVILSQTDTNTEGNNKKTTTRNAHAYDHPLRDDLGDA